MNKMLIAIFDTEAAAELGLQGLHKLHTDGDITLYASGVLVRDAKGVLSVRRAMDDGAIGAATGLAVGSLIGLLGGPVGVAIGAVTGTVAGAVRDYWTAGVGLDFIEEAEARLQPGKVALVAEIEEEWVIPLDAAMEVAGGQVFRRNRNELAGAQYRHDIGAFRAEIRDLQAEAVQAGDSAKARLQARLATAQARLDDAVLRAKQRAGSLKDEADAKAESLGTQLGQASDAAKARVEARMKAMQHAYHARGVKLSRAWGLTKEAFGA